MYSVRVKPYHSNLYIILNLKWSKVNSLNIIMIDPPKPNSIPHAILIKERNVPLTNVISHSNINICEAKNFRQIAEIKKLRSDLSCHKYCYKYDDIIQLGGIIIGSFIICIFVLIQAIM